MLSKRSWKLQVTNNENERQQWHILYYFQILEKAIDAYEVMRDDYLEKKAKLQRNINQLKAKHGAKN